MSSSKYVLVSGYRRLTAEQASYVAKVLDAEKLDSEDVIIHGGCSGVDTVADAWAKAHSIASIAFPANGHKSEDFLSRNRGMVELCGRVIAFPSKLSRGTMHTIWYAHKLSKPVKVFNIDSIEMVVENET